MIFVGIMIGAIVLLGATLALGHSPRAPEAPTILGEDDDDLT